jgi:hypothetical protein
VEGGPRRERQTDYVDGAPLLVRPSFSP